MNARFGLTSWISPPEARGSRRFPPVHAVRCVEFRFGNYVVSDWSRAESTGNEARYSRARHYPAALYSGRPHLV